MILCPASSRSLFAASFIGGLLFLFSSTVSADLDLSPRLESFELEKIPMSQLAFTTGTGKDATYQPPKGWKYSGGKDHLDLQPSGLAQAKARVTKWPAEAAITFDAEGLKQLREKILALVPEGGDQVKVEAKEINPLQIDGKQTYLVELSYTYYGERFSSYSLILDRKPELICFRFSCRESDYQSLRSAFHHSLFSWQNL